MNNHAMVMPSQMKLFNLIDIFFSFFNVSNVFVLFLMLYSKFIFLNEGIGCCYVNITNASIITVLICSSLELIRSAHIHEVNKSTWILYVFNFVTERKIKNNVIPVV